MKELEQQLQNISLAIDVAVQSGQLKRKDIVNIDQSFENIAGFVKYAVERLQKENENGEPKMEAVKEAKPKKPVTKN